MSGVFDLKEKKDWVVSSLSPAEATGGIATNFALLNAYVIVVILLCIISWIVSKSRENLTAAPTTTMPQSIALMPGVGQSIPEGFYGAPVDIGTECGDTSAEMNYAMNVINSNNPSAKNSPFWPEYYTLLSKYISLKNAANTDSTLSSWASNSFDDLKEFEERTGFNPLQQNYFDQLPPGVKPVIASGLVSTSLPTTVDTIAAAEAGAAVNPATGTFINTVKGNRAKVGGFVAGTRSKVGGFDVGKRSRFGCGVGGFAANNQSGQSGSAALMLTDPATYVPPMYNGGTDQSGTETAYQKAGVRNNSSQSMSNGSGITSAAWLADPNYQRMLY